MARPDAILWAFGRPFLGARLQVDARPNGSSCPSERYLFCVRQTPPFTRIRTACDARSDGVCFKEGRTPISLCSSSFSSFFYTVFHLKIVIS
jgi:hypothetical protein